MNMTEQKTPVIRQEIVDDEAEVIDLRELLGVVFKWKKLIAGLTILAVVAAGIVSYFILTPVYESKTVLMAVRAVDKATTANTSRDLEGVVGTLPELPNMNLNTYIEQIKSPALIGQVLNSLGLDNQYTVAGLSNMIKVQAINNTNLIEITVSNTDPVLAASIANTLREEFLSFLSKTNAERIEKAVEILESQLQIEQQRLAENTKKLQEIESQPQAIGVLEQELQSRLNDIAKYRSLSNQLLLEIQQLEAGLAQAHKQLANTPQKIDAKQITVDGLDMVVDVEEINPTYTAIEEAIRERSMSLAEKEASLRATQETISQIETEADELQLELSKRKAELERIQAEVDRSKQTYELLSEQKVATQIAMSIDIGETSMLTVAAAMVPTNPVKPNKMLNMAIAGVLGLMLSVMLAFLLEFLDNTIRDADDVHKHLQLPVLGRIPLSRDTDPNGRSLTT